MAVGGMSVNISLIEQTLGDFNHAYWLRIGVMFDDDVDNPAPLEGVNYDDILAKETAEVGESDELGDLVIGAPIQQRRTRDPIKKKKTSSCTR